MLLLICFVLMINFLLHYCTFITTVLLIIIIEEKKVNILLPDNELSLLQFASNLT